MWVNVELFGRFSKFRTKLTDGKVEIENKSFVSDLVELIGLPVDYITIILVNEEEATLETALANNDTVT